MLTLERRVAKVRRNAQLGVGLLQAVIHDSAGILAEVERQAIREAISQVVLSMSGQPDTAIRMPGGPMVTSYPCGA